MIIINIIILLVCTCFQSTQELIYRDNFNLATTEQNILIFQNDTEVDYYIVTDKSNNYIAEDTLEEGKKYKLTLVEYPIGSKLITLRESTLMVYPQKIIVENDTTKVIMYTSPNIKGNYYIENPEVDTLKNE